MVLAGVFIILYIFSTQGVGAWKYADSFADTSQPINIFNNCGITSGEAGILAEDGDVVTTQQWNKFVCRFAQSLSMLYDWGRNRTPFLWTKQNTNGGKLGTYVNALLLAYQPGIDVGDSTHGWEAGINFYNAQTLFPQANQMGYIHYVSNPTDALRMGDFEGGVRISYTKKQVNDSTYNAAWSAGSNRSDAPLGSYKDYLVGWEAINLYGTEPFNAGCIYRYHIQ